MKYIRTCQECGHSDVYAPPKDRYETTRAFDERPCKKCKSAGLDLGSEKPETPEEIEADRKAAEEWADELDKPKETNGNT